MTGGRGDRLGVRPCVRRAKARTSWCTTTEPERAGSSQARRAASRVSGRPDRRGRGRAAVRRARSASTSARPSPACGRARTCPSGGFRSSAGEATLDANLTATFLTARGFLREVGGPARQSRPRRLDRRHLRRGRPRRLCRGEVGDPGRAAAEPEERDRPHRAARARERGRAGLDGLADDPRGRSTTSRCARVSRTMALRKVAQPEDVARRSSSSPHRVLSGHVTGQVVTVAGGMEGRVVHDT